jgi:hypothetical protein
VSLAAKNFQRYGLINRYMGRSDNHAIAVKAGQRLFASGGRYSEQSCLVDAP